MYGRPRPLPTSSSSNVSQQYFGRQIVAHRNALDERTLLFLLERLQRKLYARRGVKTTLVVHGGVIAVLALKYRATTTDVDYIARTLPEELDVPMKGGSSYGVFSMLKKAFGGGKNQDVRATLKGCIAETAAEFNEKSGRKGGFELENNWMNSDADVALPWTLSSENYMVDIISKAAVMEMDEEEDIIYDSPGLRLLGIPSAWTFALKLQRYTEVDEQDIIYLLQEDGACAKYDEVTFARMVEERMKADCPQMEYDKFPERAMQEWRARLKDCVRKAKFLASTPRTMLEGH